MVSAIERSILPLDIDSQGQFISLTNALEMQLESGEPVLQVVRLLGDTILTLAKARGVSRNVQEDLS